MATSSSTGDTDSAEEMDLPVNADDEAQLVIAIHSDEEQPEKTRNGSISPHRRDSTSPRQITPKTKDDAVALEKMRIRVAAESYERQPRDNYDTLKDDTSTDDTNQPPSSSSSSRQKLARYCTIVTPVTVVLVICIAVLIGFALLSVALRIRLDAAGHICLTADCAITAGAMLSIMNLSVDRCQDFYEYSCGRFSIEYPAPPDKPSWNVFSVLQKQTTEHVKQLLDIPGSYYQGVNSTAINKAKLYFNACMNLTALDLQGNRPLQSLIDSLGSWPVTSSPNKKNGQWSSTAWSFDETMDAVHWWGVDALLAVGVTVDLANSSNNIIEFDQAGLTFSSNKVYSNEQSETFHQAFVNYFTDIGVLLGGNVTVVRKYAERVWGLEKALAGAFVSAEERSDIRTLYNLLTVSDLQQIISSGQPNTPTLDLSALLTTLFNRSIPSTEIINVAVPEYFQKLGMIIRIAHNDTLASYLVWTVVRGLIPYMPTEYQRARQHFLSVLTGVNIPPSQWERCVVDTEDALGFATGALYIDQYFSELDKQTVEELVALLIDQFSLTLKTLDWMDANTKRIAQDKAQAIVTKVGYPDFIRNVTELDDFYSTLNVTTSVFQNTLNVYRFSVKRNINKYGKVPDSSEWHDIPTQVNAYYSASHNQIVLPAGILQAPFYDFKLPVSIMFGGIGFVIAHELAHGFDNTGRQFDKYGNMVDWWGNSSAAEFVKRSQCFIDEYNSFSINDHQMNGIITLGENIADNGASRLGYDTFRHWIDQNYWSSNSASIAAGNGGRNILLPGLNMTLDQQYFLSTAQIWCGVQSTDQQLVQEILTNPHSQRSFRVNGVVRNMDQFAGTFSCSRSAALNPSQRCALF